jgi:hypothetical protein
VDLGPEPAIRQPTFSGTRGRLEYADGRATDCTYEIVQEGTGELWIRCEHQEASWVFVQGFGKPGPCRFHARTEDGLTLLLEGEFLQVHDLPDSPPVSSGVQVRYHINGPGLRVTASDIEPSPLTVRFALLNLSFSVWTHYEDGTQLDAGEGSALLLGLDDTRRFPINIEEVVCVAMTGLEGKLPDSNTSPCRDVCRLRVLHHPTCQGQGCVDVLSCSFFRGIGHPVR